ncbi:heavy metal-associated isoprenylated plant protein 2-like [Vitis riparia]|uniref:heavy metal-associated isoprenylated plant protein 2-like n=1 Tax=Vitis riparia TaxID=96939 RepID=UPI00155A0CAB|nr:heavy metal-associated isoprenylated plant protein 2-like [Vitis riparia]
MSKKTVVSVELLCSKCRQKVMKLIGAIEGITSVVLDPSKNTATVIGEADPVKIIKQVRKFKRSAMIVSIGPPKEEKKDDKSVSSQVHIHSLPKICQGCDVWYMVGADYHICSIL